jgi:trk system potassium uptake protein TrkA
MSKQVIVVGLGQFGSAVARELSTLGNEVLAVDIDEAAVNDIAPDVTHAVQLDASAEGTLRSIGAADFSAAIVGMAADTDASIFATMALQDLGVRTIAKAGGTLHARILERVGAERVISPEHEAGVQVAHTFDITGVVDYLVVAPRFGVARVVPPAAYIGRSLRELDLQARYQLTPIALRRGERVIVNPARDEVLRTGDELVLVGRDEGLARFGE